MSGVDWSGIVSGGVPYAFVTALIGLVVWLVRRIIKAADDRAEIWKHLYDTEHETVNILLPGVQASTVAAEAIERVATAIPVVPPKEG